MATDGAGGGGGRHKFFKILLPGSFELSLSIPPKFAAGLGAWRAAKLRDGTGRRWDVDLLREGHGRVSLTGRGWRGFVSANGISAGQLLVLEHTGCLDLAVDIFDASGCLVTDHNTNATNGGLFPEDDGPKTPTCIPEEAAAASAASSPGTGVKRRRKHFSPSSMATAGSGHYGRTLCRRIDRPYQLRFLDLSKSFCDAVGWTSSRDVELVVCAAGGDSSWQVSVKVSAKSGMMCSGWTEFAQDNRLALSDACVFVPLHAGVLQVRVIRGSSPPS